MRTVEDVEHRRQEQLERAQPPHNDVIVPATGIGCQFLQPVPVGHTGHHRAVDVAVGATAARRRNRVRRQQGRGIAVGARAAPQAEAGCAELGGRAPGDDQRVLALGQAVLIEQDRRRVRVGRQFDVGLGDAVRHIGFLGCHVDHVPHRAGVDGGDEEVEIDAQHCLRRQRSTVTDQRRLVDEETAAGCGRPQVGEAIRHLVGDDDRRRRRWTVVRHDHGVGDDCADRGRLCQRRLQR